MSPALVMPTEGRGAWRGIGGTLDLSGMAPGGFYVKNAAGVAMVGSVAYKALTTGHAVDLNAYAVFGAVRAIQHWLSISADGLFGSGTQAAVKSFQTVNHLVADGVYGPASARVMWQPTVERAVYQLDSAHEVDLLRMAKGHMSIESGWDPGAIGRSTPDDVGIMQISRKNHPSMTTDLCLDPATAIPYAIQLIDANLIAMKYNVRDGVAAYNLGVGGAREWVVAGRPDSFARTVNGKTVYVAVADYIRKVLGY